MFRAVHVEQGCLHVVSKCPLFAQREPNIRWEYHRPLVECRIINVIAGSQFFYLFELLAEELTGALGKTVKTRLRLTVCNFPFLCLFGFPLCRYQRSQPLAGN